ncbi:MAG: isochorismatase family protein [Gammaproteobacteria bacterium]|nr:isochorismatase family protein [Gammaproteobacteria bacterium]MCY4210503.1 isochorismatase family protein [Gammaproteobacteria bacterium]
MTTDLLNLLDLKKSALIVIDLQNAFCHQDGTLGKSGLDTERLGSVIKPLRTVIERGHAVGMPVLWTVQEHFATDSRRARKRLPSHTSKRKGVSALAGSWDAQIVDELQDLVTDPTYVIRKHRFGGFYETRLQLVLEQLGVEALFITGLTANACVETTMREAYLRDFDVVAVEDCISGVNPAWEQSAREVWRQYLGVTCQSADFLAWVDRQLQPKPVYVHHLLLMVSDLERSMDFYLNTLGFTRRVDAKPLPDGRPFIATMEGLGLTAGGPGDMKQLDHLAFEVRNVEAMYEKLKQTGAEFPRGELGPGPYGKAIYVLDPDGNELELFER